ncbi:IS200/IS605 family transposase [Planctomycetota bacterium]
MSKHSYTRCWLHLIWATLKRERTLHREACRKISNFLSEYAQSKEIYMKINFVNADHVHALIDLPANYSIEEVAHLLKGASSHWINQNEIITGRFSWGRGYAVFSVSHSQLAKIIDYIIHQEQHHHTKTFAQEYEEFIKAYGLQLPREINR